MSSLLCMALVIPLGATGVPATAQEMAPIEPPRYDSRFVEANGIRLQYVDFGGVVVFPEPDAAGNGACR